VFRLYDSQYSLLRLYSTVQNIMYSRALFALLLIAFKSDQFIQSFCDGKWEGSNSPDISSYQIVAARNHYNSSTARNSSLEFVNTACPAQVAHYTCYYLGDPQRAKIIEFKRFIPNPSSNEDDGCLPFHPLEFLELIRNREVILHGDSIIGNVWTSLFCSLYSVTESKYFIDFKKLVKQCDELCPLGKAAHSYKHGGSIKFEHFNTTIHFMLANSYSPNLVKFIESHKHSIIIYNVGLHYNEKPKFDKDMGSAASALSAYFVDKRQRNESIPLVFFAETSPQHFDANPNGYYGQLTGNYAGVRKCVPIVKEGIEGHNLSTIYQADWRNRLVTKHFESLIQQGDITSIPWAKGLYEQYDQHIETSPFSFTPFDCTHWCFPSGVDRYMLLILYNALFRRLDPVKWKLYNEERNIDTQSKSLGPVEGDLVKSMVRKEIFLIQNGQKRIFTSWDAFEGRGYSLNNVRGVDEATLNKFETGPPLD
jgi:hypothetical protein